MAEYEGRDVRRSHSGRLRCDIRGPLGHDGAVDARRAAGAGPPELGSGPSARPARRPESRCTASTPRSGWSRSCARSGGTEIRSRSATSRRSGSPTVRAVYFSRRALAARQEQVRCFHNVAGSADVARDRSPILLVQSWRQPRMLARRNRPDAGGHPHDAVSQTLVSQYVVLMDGGVRSYRPAAVRLAERA